MLALLCNVTSLGPGPPGLQRFSLGFGWSGLRVLELEFSGWAMCHLIRVLDVAMLSVHRTQEAS